jgi:hypothetical protein
MDVFLQDLSDSSTPARYNSELIVSNQGEDYCRMSVNGTEVTWPDTGEVRFSTALGAEYEVECLACPTGKTFADFHVSDWDSGVSQKIASNPIHLKINKTKLHVYVEYVEDAEP